MQELETSLLNASSEVEALKPELKVVHEKLKATNQQLTATQQKLLKEQDERQKLNDAVVEAEHEVVKARSDAKAQQREATVSGCVAELFTAESRDKADQQVAALKKDMSGMQKQISVSERLAPTASAHACVFEPGRSTSTTSRVSRRSSRSWARSTSPSARRCCSRSSRIATCVSSCARRSLASQT